MNNTEFWKNMFQAFNFQLVYHQGTNVLSYVASVPYTSAQESSKKFPQGDQAVSSSYHNTLTVSLKKKNMSRHLAWLKHSILKTVNKLLWGAILGGNYQSFQFDENLQEDSLVDYLQKGKSLIPTEMVQMFARCLTQLPNLHKVLTWVYEHEQPKFGDELILIAFRVLMAYLPIKQIGLSYQQIRSIPLSPFNLFDIYNVPTLKILHFSSFCKETNGSGQFDPDLYRFCVAYIDTILLVLEGYYQNPYYKQIQQQKEGRKDGSNDRPWSKKKKISKRK